MVQLKTLVFVCLISLMSYCCHGKPCYKRSTEPSPEDEDPSDNLDTREDKSQESVIDQILQHNQFVAMKKDGVNKRDDALTTVDVDVGGKRVVAMKKNGVTKRDDAMTTVDVDVRGKREEPKPTESSQVTLVNSLCF